MQHIPGATLQGVRSMNTPVSGNQQREVRVGSYHGINDTIQAMRKLAIMGQSHPEVRQYAENVIRKVYPKDYLSELAAVYYDVCRTMRYTRDPAGHEYVQHPVVALRSRAVDCDDQATLLRSVIGAVRDLATRGMSVGNAVEFVTVGFVANASPGSRYTHVFIRVYDPKTGQYLVLDPVAGPTTRQMLAKVRVHKLYQT